MPKHETWHKVGNKIRYLRKSNGLTQKQLARGCDLSINTISLVERSEVCANIETLCKIANALCVTPGSLFLDICKPRIVLERAIKTDSEIDIAELSIQILSAPDCATDSILEEPSSGLGSGSEGRHSILCLCGQVELEMDGQNYLLNPGDSLSFNSDAFQRWRNTETTTGIAVFVLPPSSL